MFSWAAFVAAVAAVFAVGTWQFVVFLMCLVAFALYQVQWDNGDRAGIAVLLALLGFQFCGPEVGGFKPFTLIYENPADFGILFLKFMVGFIIWFPIRFLIYSTDIINEVDDFKSDFLKNHGITGSLVPSELMKEWIDLFKRNFLNINPNDPRPQVSEHRLACLRWGWFWIIDAPWTISRKFFHRVGRFLYNFFRPYIQKVNDWLWSDMIRSFPVGQVVAVAAPAVTTEAPAAKK